MTTARRIQTLVGLIIFMGLTISHLSAVIEHIPRLGPYIGRDAFWFALTVLVVLYVLLVERRPLSSIGFRRPTWKTFVFAIAAAVVSVAGIVAIFGFVFPVLHLHANTGAMNKILASPYWSRVMLVTRAAVAEEIIFRGYAIERLDELTGSRTLAATVSWALFTIAHLSSWGWSQLIVAGFGGLTLTVLYLWRRDLPSNMLAHFITDGAGFLLR